MYRPSLGREARSDCLVLRLADSTLDEDTAVAVVREWIRFENRDYYRISAPSTTQFNTMLYYDARAREGMYWAKSQGEDDRATGPMTALSAVWDTTLSRIRALAAQVDAAVRTPSTASTVA